MDVFWYLCGPDGRYPWRPDGARPLTYPYMQQVARAVDHLGFTGALLATGAHDTWVLASSLVPYTKDFQFLVAVHPSLVNPVLAAKMTSTLDDFSGGRVKLNIVTGNTALMQSYGDTLSKDERYAQTREWLEIFKRLMAGETVDHPGVHYQVKGGSLTLPPTQRPHPPLYFGGQSPAALDVAADHIDTFLTWGEPPAQAEETIGAMKRKAAAAGREMTYGIRLYIVVRDTEDEAWAAAQDLYDHMDEESIARTMAGRAGNDSVGQARMARFGGTTKAANLRDMEIYPNLWSGLGLVRNGPGTMIVGSPDQVVARLHEYRDIGIDTFIVSGMPLLEEAYRVGELVLPRLPMRRRAQDSAITSTWNSWGQGWKDARPVPASG
jgi:alkanesulfonate monooxygenase